MLLPLCAHHTHSIISAVPYIRVYVRRHAFLPRSCVLEELVVVVEFRRASSSASRGPCGPNTNDAGWRSSSIVTCASSTPPSPTGSPWTSLSGSRCTSPHPSPLTSRLHLSPGPLLPTFPVSDAPVPPSSSATSPPRLPTDLHLSPTSNYPAPHGTALLGETVRASIRLRNISNLSNYAFGSSPGEGIDVRGAKMMIEVQSPGARTRLGEAVHGGRAEGTEPAAAEERPWDALPKLKAGEGMEIEVAHDVAELGAHILICSVAWETEEGRRTFQRFLKFNVSSVLWQAIAGGVRPGE